MQSVSSKSIYYSVIIIPYKDIGGVHRVLVNLRNVSKMADFCIFKEFHKISKIFDLVSIISIWQIMLLLYLVSILYVLKISIFYMKINLATAIYCGVLFHGGSCLTEALVDFIHMHAAILFTVLLFTFSKLSYCPVTLHYYTFLKKRNQND